MYLSKQQFEDARREERLTISLIGMSNIGKTYWSDKLQKTGGFERIGCDNLIEARLAPALRQLGYAGISDVARWMGQPYDERFPLHQQTYLSWERQTMEDIFAQIKNKKNKNTIVDTTGSIVHTGEAICAALQQHSLVVYLEASPDMHEAMFARYLKNPKPVVFGDMFVQKANETVAQALQRCYQALLQERGRLYRQYADVIIPRVLLNQDMNADQFLSLIGERLVPAADGGL